MPLNALSDSVEPNALSDVLLLTQTGYLTIKAVEYGTTVFVGYPNKEVRTAIAQLYMEQLLDGRVAGQVGTGPIIRVLREESPESLFHILNRLFLSIDYNRYPVKDEFSVRAFVQIYFAGAGLEPIVERHNAHGRSELEIKIDRRNWILEFKTARSHKEAEDKLEEAVRQIKENKYGSETCSQESIRVALVYSLDKREFVLWKQC